MTIFPVPLLPSLVQYMQSGKLSCHHQQASSHAGDVSSVTNQHRHTRNWWVEIWDMLRKTALSCIALFRFYVGRQSVMNGDVVTGEVIGAAQGRGGWLAGHYWLAS